MTLQTRGEVQTMAAAELGRGLPPLPSTLRPQCWSRLPAHRCTGIRRCGDTGSCRTRRSHPRSGLHRSTRNARTGTRRGLSRACPHPRAGRAACRSESPWSSCRTCHSWGRHWSLLHSLGGSLGFLGPCFANHKTGVPKAWRHVQVMPTAAARLKPRVLLSAH